MSYLAWFLVIVLAVYSVTVTLTIPECIPCEAIDARSQRLEAEWCNSMVHGARNGE
jgi:hypothetical protein